MVIALLAVLGVDLIVVAALLALVLSRKRWVKRQPGAFHGAIRVTGGEIDGLRPKWSRGYGHWVRDVCVRVRVGDVTVEIAIRGDDSELALGPRPTLDAAGVATKSRSWPAV